MRRGIPYFVWFHKVTPTPSTYTVGWGGWRMKTWFLFRNTGRVNYELCPDCGELENGQVRSVDRPIFAPNVVRPRR